MTGAYSPIEETPNSCVGIMRCGRAASLHKCDALLYVGFGNVFDRPRVPHDAEVATNDAMRFFPAKAAGFQMVDELLAQHRERPVVLRCSKLMLLDEGIYSELRLGEDHPGAFSCLCQGYKWVASDRHASCTTVYAIPRIERLPPAWRDPEDESRDGCVAILHLAVGSGCDTLDEVVCEASSGHRLRIGCVAGVAVVVSLGASWRQKVKKIRYSEAEMAIPDTSRCRRTSVGEARIVEPAGAASNVAEPAFSAGGRVERRVGGRAELEVDCRRSM